MTIEIAYRRSCPCNWFPLTYGILVGGYAFTIGIGCWGGLFGLTTDSTGPLRTHLQTPLWAKYMILVARKGTLQCGSCVLTDIYIQSSRSGSFFCVLSRTCPKTREFFNTASRLIGNGFVPRQSSRKKMGFGAIDCVMHRTALVLSNH